MRTLYPSSLSKPSSHRFLWDAPVTSKTLPVTELSYPVQQLYSYNGLFSCWMCLQWTHLPLASCFPRKYQSWCEAKETAFGRSWAWWPDPTVLSPRSVAACPPAILCGTIKVQRNDFYSTRTVWFSSRNEAIQLSNKFTFPARRKELRMQLLELRIFQLSDCDREAWQTGTALLRTSMLTLSLHYSTGIYLLFIYLLAHLLFIIIYWLIYSAISASWLRN